MVSSEFVPEVNDLRLQQYNEGKYLPETRVDTDCLQQHPVRREDIDNLVSLKIKSNIPLYRAAYNQDLEETIGNIMKRKIVFPSSFQVVGDEEISELKDPLANYSMFSRDNSAAISETGMDYSMAYAMLNRRTTIPQIDPSTRWRSVNKEEHLYGPLELRNPFCLENYRDCDGNWMNNLVQPGNFSGNVSCNGLETSSSTFSEEPMLERSVTDSSGPIFYTREEINNIIQNKVLKCGYKKRKPKSLQSQKQEPLEEALNNILRRKLIIPEENEVVTYSEDINGQMRDASVPLEETILMISEKMEEEKVKLISNEDDIDITKKKRKAHPPELEEENFWDHIVMECCG